MGNGVFIHSLFHLRLCYFTFYGWRRAIGEGRLEIGDCDVIMTAKGWMTRIRGYKWFVDAMALAGVLQFGVSLYGLS